jgi:uncharacterized protein YggE
MRFKALLVALILSSSLAHADGKNDIRLISVTGEAKTQVVPDIVEISLTVETTNKNLNIAQKNNDEIAAKLLNLTKALGIDPKNVQTNSVNMQPNYEYNCPAQPCTKPTLSGFTSKKGVQIKLTDTAKLQELLEKSTEAGGHIDGINFASSKLEEIKNEVQITAAKNALQKADDIAAALNVKVKKPYRISVGYSSPISPRVNMMMAKVASAEAADTIAPGEVSINATVNADFEIE